MLHPSEAAIDYVSERLLETYFDADDDALRDSVRRVRAAHRHRHARPQSEAARKFASVQLNQVKNLRVAHPYLDLDEEQRYFAAMLELG